MCSAAATGATVEVAVAVVAAAPTRETPTVGIVYRGIQCPYCLALSPPLLDKPLLIYLLNNTTAALSLVSPSSPPRSLSSLNGLLRAPSLSMPSDRYCFTGSVESCRLRCITTQGGSAPREGVNWSDSIGTLWRERSDYRKWEICRYRHERVPLRTLWTGRSVSFFLLSLRKLIDFSVFLCSRRCTLPRILLPCYSLLDDIDEYVCLLFVY